MYKLNPSGILNFIVVRANILSKLCKKKTKKQTLVFLRAPKHFNIGKRKVFSFVNKTQFYIEKNFCFSYFTFLNSRYTLDSFYKTIITFLPNIHLNSFKTNIKLKIKFF